MEESDRGSCPECGGVVEWWSYAQVYRCRGCRWEARLGGVFREYESGNGGEG